MKKLILLSALLAALMISCKKKKDDPAPSTTENKTPSVAITGPENNSSSHSDEVTITVTASDTDGSIAKVEFYDGTTKLGEDASSPYSLDVTLNVGTHSFTAKAYDNKNASTTSTTINYTVNSGPVVVGPMEPAK